jgi:hypothetical protein
MPKITVQSEGVTISEKRTVNLVAGENVTITPTNNSGHGALDIEISASGGAAATIPSFESCTTNITTPATSGTSVAAGALAHNKNTTYTELISSLGFDAYWVEILVGNVFTNATDTGLLLDIATGTAGNETVIIPNLNCGHAAAWSTSGMGGQRYAFPLFIPSGSRISATAQAVVGGDTVDVGIWLYGGATAPDFIGTSVTAYGVDLASSQGTVITAGNGSEGAWGQITAATSATPLLLGRSRRRGQRPERYRADPRRGHRTRDRDRHQHEPLVRSRGNRVHHASKPGAYLEHGGEWHSPRGASAGRRGHHLRRGPLRRDTRGPLAP